MTSIEPVDSPSRGTWSIDGTPASSLPASPLPRRSPNAVVAAARPIEIGNREEVKRLRKSQAPDDDQLWAAYDNLGENGVALDWAANVVSKIRLIPVTWPDPEREPTLLPKEGHEAEWAAIERLKRPYASHANLLRRWALNWLVAGDGYLLGLGHPSATSPASGLPPVPSATSPGSPDLPPLPPSNPNAERWSFRSRAEIKIENNKWVLAEDDSQRPRPLTLNDSLTRLWIPHARRFHDASPPLRRVLDATDILILLQQEIRSSLATRLVNCILGIPNELSFGSPDPTTDGEPEADPFISQLYEILETARQNPGSAEYVGPLVIRGEAEYLDKIVWKVLDRPIDERVPELVNQFLKRLATSLPFPREILEGMGDATGWNGFTISREAWTHHLEPLLAIPMVDTLTPAFYWPVLGITPDQVDENTPRVWFDPSAAFAQSDKAADYDKGYDVGEVSGKAWRKARNIPEDDAPTDLERLLRIATNKSALDPTLTAAILSQLLGIKIDTSISAAPSNAPTDTGGEVPRKTVPSHRAIPSETAPPPNRDGSPSKRHTVPVGDVHPMTERMVGAADSACRRELERAGSRIRTHGQSKHRDLLKTVSASPNSMVAAALSAANVSKMGLRESDLIDGTFPDLKDQFQRWAKSLDIPSHAVQHAWSQLTGDLEQVCRRALYSPPDDFAPVVEPIVAAAIDSLLTPGVFS